MKICLQILGVFPGDRDYDTLEHPVLHNNTLKSPQCICITFYSCMIMQENTILVA